MTVRNQIGTLYAAVGVALIALPFSRAVAFILAGAVLVLAAVLLLIDWDGR